MRLAHRSLAPIAGILAAIAIVASSGGAQSSTPPWRTQLIPWESHAEQPRPWRDDARLAGRAPEGYPDDFRVLFPNPDSASGGQHEIMWVRVIAHHAPSDQFLGILLNQPHYLKAVRQGDNVAFRIDAARGMPAAVGVALAKPDKKVIGLLGDGSAMYSIQALWSAAQLKLPITFIILKNRRYAALQEFAPTFGFHEGDKLEGTDLPDLDFLALARGQGCEAVRVSDPALLHQVLRDALASQHAILVEVDVA